MLQSSLALRTVMAVLPVLAGFASLHAAEPPALNPFGPAQTEREDAVPGRLELSDGSVHRGMIYLTRDKRLQILDKEMQRQREIPLRVVKKIECSIKKEWLEKEWRFKESANDEKVYSGRSYPVREYLHTITLNDGRTITGPLSAIIYVQPPQYNPVRPEQRRPPVQPERFLLSKRNKAEMGETLKSLIYVKRITFGEDAAKEVEKEAEKDPAASDTTEEKQEKNEQ